jgi:hypothetical protein
VDVNTLARNNRLKDPDRLEVGQILWVPGDKKAEVPSPPRVSQSATGGRQTKPKPKPTSARMSGRRKLETRPVIPEDDLADPREINDYFPIRPERGGYHRGIDLPRRKGPRWWRFGMA